MSKYAIKFTQPSKTKQSFKKETQISYMLDQYRKTGLINGSNKQQLVGDYTDVPTYQEALNITIQANQQFKKLPAKIRDRFANNPTNMLQFLNDKDNLNEAITLGLVEKSTAASAGETGATATSTATTNPVPPTGETNTPPA